MKRATLTAYEVRKQEFDTARPWSVIRLFRGFNRIAGRYPSERQARKRAFALQRDYDHKHAAQGK